MWRDLANVAEGRRWAGLPARSGELDGRRDLANVDEGRRWAVLLARSGEVGGRRDLAGLAEQAGRYLQVDGRRRKRVGVLVRGSCGQHLVGRPGRGGSARLPEVRHGQGQGRQGGTGLAVICGRHAPRSNLVVTNVRPARTSASAGQVLCVRHSARVGRSGSGSGVCRAYRRTREGVLFHCGGFEVERYSFSKHRVPLPYSPAEGKAHFFKVLRRLVTEGHGSDGLCLGGAMPRPPSLNPPLSKRVSLQWWKCGRF